MSIGRYIEAWVVKHINRYRSLLFKAKCSRPIDVATRLAMLETIQAIL